MHSLYKKCVKLHRYIVKFILKICFVENIRIFYKCFKIDKICTKFKLLFLNGLIKQPYKTYVHMHPKGRKRA